jgi:competence protein ComEA
MSADTDERRWIRSQQAAVVGAIALLLIGLISWRGLRVGVSGPDESTPSTEPLADRIDPNRAPWWELAQLPGIGEVTAKAIVDYRQRHQTGGNLPSRVFSSAEDLQAVHGIGPKTVARLREHLVFPQDRARVDRRGRK